ncbi:MAG: VWA domain-containing protein [Acidobacteriota bacterium]
MRFLDPGILYGLLLIPILWATFFFADRRARAALALFGEPRLIDPTRRSPPAWVIRGKRLLLTLGLAFMFLALARPQWGEKMEEVRRKGLDIMIVLDVSASMDAPDPKPSRLEAARGEIGAFLDLLEADRVGLVCFAGEPALICPLTLDYSAVKIFLDSVDTSTISRPGTAIGRAIELALESFSQREKKYKVVVLLTDGEDHEGRAAAAARKARDEGVVIFTIGIGTPGGELIPVRDAEGQFREWKKDDKGQVVQSRLDAATLQDVAATTGGKFFAITTGGDELKRIAEEIAAMDKKEVHARLQTVYEERYQWFLLPGVVFLFGLMAIPEKGRNSRR